MLKSKTNQNVMDTIKGKLIFRHIFFAALACRTPMIEDRSIPTLQTDGESIWYNPDFLLEQNDQVRLFALVHELVHIIAFHATIRARGRDERKWQWAIDMATNCMLKDFGFTLWDKCCYDAALHGKSAEELYKIAPEFPPQDAMGFDIRPGAKERSPAEQSDLEEKIKQNVVAAGILARGEKAGVMTGAMWRFINGVTDPQVPWTDLLRDYAVTSMNPSEETWNKQNRRMTALYPDFVFPDADSELDRIGEVVIVGDTSASIGQKELDLIATEGLAIAEQMHPERIRVVWADDTPCSSEQVFEEGELELSALKPKGGGGTDMRKPLRYIEQYEPRVAILVTDGLTPWPAQETPYPLIICCTTTAECPSWAKIVRVTT